MKNKLKEHFGSKIVISELDGRSNVVTLQTTATEILHDFYQNTRKTDSGKIKKKIN